MKQLYFCVGCRQVHYDNDYCKEDGDLLITDWNNFLESVNKIKLTYLHTKSQSDIKTSEDGE